MTSQDHQRALGIHSIQSNPSITSHHSMSLHSFSAPSSPTSLRQELSETIINCTLNPIVNTYFQPPPTFPILRVATVPRRITRNARRRRNATIITNMPDNITIPHRVSRDDDTVDTHKSLHSDSTITAEDKVYSEKPYHNPKFLGNMAYYYPPRIQRQAVAAVNIDTDPDPQSDSDKEGITTIESIPVSDVIPDRQSRRFHQSHLQSCWDTFQTSCDILKPNEHWGDEISVKQEHTVRIYFQNLNSCSLSKSSSKWNTMLDSMLLSECDIMNFAQISINWKVVEIQNCMRNSLKLKMPINRLNVSQNKYYTDQLTLPGGTAQVLKGDWTGRIVKYIHDPRRMGRWCGVKLRMKCERHLYIISDAYRVCVQQASKIGVDTAYNQQKLMLSLEGMKSPDPRKVFIRDMIHQVKQWKSDMDDVIIVLNANEHLGDSVHGLTH